MLYHLTFDPNKALSIYDNGLNNSLPNDGTIELDKMFIRKYGLNHQVVQARKQAIYLYYDRYLPSILNQMDRNAYIFRILPEKLDLNKMYVSDQHYLNQIFDGVATSQKDIEWNLQKYVEHFKHIKDYNEDTDNYSYAEHLYLDSIPVQAIQLVRKPLLNI
ncbi:MULTISPECIES: hypothetical protein [Bacillus cereus group]|uniref:Uncharacterized protein n=1 Tax=Bacillus cereus TaxID=1396 RepID=A0ABD7DRA8_BACCE|nr:MULTISPECIES: hypothetical protein [Bacillus cereus group]QRY18161.1 hypothetical protein JTF64_13175 [Bacillus cereus]